MPLFLVERNFAEELELGAGDVLGIEAVNDEVGVRWVHSFLSADKRKTYCLYEATSAEMIQEAARRNNSPADAIIGLGAAAGGHQDGAVGPSVARPRRSAHAAASVRLTHPVLSRIARTWLAAVCWLMLSSAPTSRFVHPSARRRSTATSRAVSPTSCREPWGVDSSRSSSWRQRWASPVIPISSARSNASVRRAR